MRGKILDRTTMMVSRWRSPVLSKEEIDELNK
jgi:hypothetical protein